MRFYPREGVDFGTLSIRDYMEWKARNRVFEEPALFTSRRMDVVGVGVPEQIAGSIVTNDDNKVTEIIIGGKKKKKKTNN